MSTSTLLALFAAGLALTVVALVVALVLAHQHRPRGHIAGIVAFVAALLPTLVAAELIGARFDFAPEARRIHLALAWATAAFLLAPMASGVQHWRGRVSRGAHKRISQVFLVLVALTVGTGVWMLSTRIERPAAGGGPG